MWIYFLLVSSCCALPFQFVHIPKTGGTALDKYFASYYPEYIDTDTWYVHDNTLVSKHAPRYVHHHFIESADETCESRTRPHDRTAADVHRPILVLRDPFERIASSFNYWKYGSELYSLENTNVSLMYYLVNILRKNHSRLSTAFTWEHHYKPMVHWIPPEHFSKSVIVMYNRDLNTVIEPLLKVLKIKDDGHRLPKINVPLNKSVVWNSGTRHLVRKLYADDFKLLETVAKHPEKFAAVIGEPITMAETPQPIIILIYITHINDQYQQNKIAELYRTFGDKLMVSWDNKEQPDCPFPNVTCINVTLDEVRTYDWVTSGTGHEKALMWSMKNYKAFDRVWIMEEDIYYTDIAFVHQVVTFNYDRDLILTSRPTKLSQNKHVYHRLVEQWKSLQITNWSWAQQQFFGASKKMVQAMHQTYTRNNDTLIFLETMWSTVATIHGLKTGGWYSFFSNFSKNFRFRPCYTNFSMPGLYHPAKNRKGTFIHCNDRKHNTTKIRL